MNHYISEAINPEDEIEVPPTLWHVTPKGNKNSILKNGLLPQHGYLTSHAGSDTGEPKVYLGMQSKTMIYGSQVVPLSFLKDNAMLAVSTEGLELEPVRNTANGFFQNEFTSTKAIPPENISYAFNVEGDHAEHLRLGTVAYPHHLPEHIKQKIPKQTLAAKTRAANIERQYEYISTRSIGGNPTGALIVIPRDFETQGGLQPNDIITHLDGQLIESNRHYSELMKTLIRTKQGEEVNLTHIPVDVGTPQKMKLKIGGGKD